MIASRRLRSRVRDAADDLRDAAGLRMTIATALDRGWTRAAETLRSPLSRRHLLWAVLAVASTTALMLPVRGALGVLNVLLIFLLLTFALAFTLGSGPATLAAVLSFLAFD